MSGETVTRLRATPILDPYSGEVTSLSWDAPDELPITGVAVDDSKTTELREPGREAVVTDYVLYADAHWDVLSSDRVMVRGNLCKVEGRPSSPHNPFTGDEPGMVIHANIVEG